MNNEEEEDGNDELEVFSESLLCKIYDSTGNKRGCNKGFLMFMVNHNGEIIYVSKFSDTVTQIALTETAKKILLEEDFQEDD
jgi:hypothetical protein